jgi:cold shock CspA family protein
MPVALPADAAGRPERAATDAARPVLAEGTTAAQPGSMVRSGKSRGTVVRWDEAQGRGFLESPDLPGECWIDAGVAPGGRLRAGQVVDVQWEERDDGGLRAVRIVPREDLQAGFGA